MNCDRLKLYAVTDSRWTSKCGGKLTLAEQVELCILGGATMIQYREKYDESIEEARELQAVCKKYSVPFIINDDVMLAKQLDADGVHIGQSDMQLLEARKILGKDKIVGVSAQTVEQAIEAEKNGADYLGVGAVFPTGSKSDAVDVSYDQLKSICNAVKIPVVAIGGISEKNIFQLKNSGIVGVAVISAIFAQDDIELAAKNLRSLADEYFGGER